MADEQGTGSETAVAATVEPVPKQPTQADIRQAKIDKALAARRGTPAIEAKPVEAKLVETPTPTPVETETSTESTTQYDAQTTRALEAIEKRDKRAREQLDKDRAAFKAEMEQSRAEIARIKAEASGKTPSLEELKKLPAAKRAIEAMKLAGLDPDDEEAMEVIARDTYARSKSGKADPKNRVYADQLAERNGLEAQLAELRRMVEETRSSLTERDQRAQLEQFQGRYLDEAVKAIPAEPTFIGQAVKANPERARQHLLSIGQELERELGETPTHAEVIAEYEKRSRQDLRDRGLNDAQITALLTPAKPAPVAAPAPRAPARTLDPSTGPSTPPINGQPSRDQKLARAREGLKQLRAQN